MLVIINVLKIYTLVIYIYHQDSVFGNTNLIKVIK